MVQASAEKLEHSEPSEKESVASVPQSKQLARTPEPPLPKEKEQNHLSRTPDREVKESQSEREPHLGKKKGSEQVQGEEIFNFT